MTGLRIAAKYSNIKEMLLQFESDERAFADAIVLIDYSMPNINGVEASKRLRQIRPNQKIIISTAMDPAYLEEDLRLFDAVLRKPFAISELTAALVKASIANRCEGEQKSSVRQKKSKSC